jgi:hypothetical protein
MAIQTRSLGQSGDLLLLSVHKQKGLVLQVLYYKSLQSVSSVIAISIA